MPAVRNYGSASLRAIHHILSTSGVALGTGSHRPVIRIFLCHANSTRDETGEDARPPLRNSDSHSHASPDVLSSGSGVRMRPTAQVVGRVVFVIPSKGARTASQTGKLLSSTGTPPPPFISQNLEKTRFILRLSARSLSLKELHAESREHWSYGGARRPILKSRDAFAGSRSRASTWVRLSKINDYLVDNVRCDRLSDVEARSQ